MCGGYETRDSFYDREQRRLRLARVEEERLEDELRIEREARQKRARAAKRRAAALKAKRVASAKKAAATRRRNKAKAAKVTVAVRGGSQGWKSAGSLTVILKPVTQTSPAIPRRKIAITPMKARSLRMN
jgi:hypothetical protein